MSLRVRNKGFEVHRTLKGQFCGRVVDIKIDGVTIETPKTVPSKKELEYFSQADRRTADLSVVQYVTQMRHFGGFQSSADQTREKLLYESFLRANQGSIVDFFLQYPHRFNLTNRQQAMAMDLQNDTVSKFVSHFEQNRNQKADVFEKEIILLRKTYNDKIFTPSVHMKTEKEGLIRKKVKVVLNNGFQRVNVIYASILENPSNWFALSNLIYDKDLWVNVVGVLPRMTIKEKTAMIPWTFLFGANTTSLAKAWGGGSAYPRHLNRDTSCFDIVDRNISYPKSRAENVKETEIVSQDIKNSILQQNLFRNLVRNRAGLRDIINRLR